jgi:hypothetical protein
VVQTALAATVVTDIVAVVTAATAVTAAAVSYFRLVLDRANLGAQVDVDFVPLTNKGRVVGDLCCMVKNLGSNTLSVTRLEARGRYSVITDAPETHGIEPMLDHRLPENGERTWIPMFAVTKQSSTSDTPASPGANTPSSLPASTPSSPTANTPSSPDARTPAADPSSRTVVFPGGTQAYRIPVVLDEGAELLTVWVSCDYKVEVGRLTRFLAGLRHSARAGLNFSGGLKNHQVRRTFNVTTRPPSAGSNATGS